LECDTDGFLILRDPESSYPENCLNFAVDCIKDRCGEFRARKAYIAASGYPNKCIDGEPGHEFSLLIDAPEFLDDVTFAADLGSSPIRSAISKPAPQK